MFDIAEAPYGMPQRGTCHRRLTASPARPNWRPSRPLRPATDCGASFNLSGHSDLNAFTQDEPRPCEMTDDAVAPLVVGLADEPRRATAIG